MVVLEVREVSKVINREKVLDNINFQIEKGEIFGLAGPNGAGKTTLMKLMVGLTKIDNGDILLFNESVKSSKISVLEKVGSMIEEPSFYNFFSGEENLKYFASFYSDISRNRIHSLLRLVGLFDSKDKLFKKYSMGMKQRLGIANALLHEPKFLVLDEPTNALDPTARREFQKLLKTLSLDYGITILFSTHNLVEIEQTCNRYAVLVNGNIKFIHNIESKPKKIDETVEENYHEVIKIGGESNV